MSTRFLRYSLTPILLLFASFAQAQGDLLITPKRLVFDGSKRVEEINLANIGKDTATYSIAFTQFKMDENGNFIQISDADSTQKFAHKNLRFFPRTVTLAPNEAQSIKVQLIKANELSPGEYRSHLYFKNTLLTSALGDEKSGASKDSRISVSLKPSFGISIATIIRVGECSVNGNITDAVFIPGTAQVVPLVSFTINRSGNMSLYGDLKLTHISTDNIRTDVGIMKGLAVYTPNAFRKLRIPVNKTTLVDYKTGKLLIEYIDQANPNKVIATQQITL